jgi:predicted permease
MSAPPRWLTRLYRAALRLQPAAHRARYDGEQMRLFEDIYSAECPRSTIPRLAWSVDLLARMVRAAWRTRRDGRDARAPRYRVASGGGLGPMRTDLKFTLRSLVHARWYAATIAGVVALTLALGATAFAVVDGVLFRPLPYPAPDRLVTVEPNFRGVKRPTFAGGGSLHYGVSVVDLENWKAAAPEARITAFNPAQWSGMGAGVNDDVVGMAEVLPDFFDVLGVRPIIGGFSDDDFAQRALVRPVILSDETWTGRFGRAPDIVGRTVIVDTARTIGFRVAGVMPRGFTFPSTRATIDMITPLVTTPSARTNPASRGLSDVIARLPAGMTPDRFEERLGAGLAATAAQFPPQGPKPAGYSDNYWRTEGPYDMVDAVPLGDALRRSSGRMFLGAFAGVVLLALLAAANVSSLMTARAWERRRELDMRRSLGAPPLAIARIWLLESLSLVAAGAVLGALLAIPALQIITSLLPDDVVLLKPARVDWRTVGFVGLSAMLLAACVAIAPIRRSLRAPASDSGRGGASDRVRTRARFLVVAGQVSAALVLTVVGACFVGSVLAVYSNDLGVRTRDTALLEARVQGAGGGMGPSDERTARARHILDALARDQNVAVVGLADAQVMRGGGWTSPFLPPAGAHKLPTTDMWAITEGFFDAIDLTAVEGRLPTADELRAGAPLVVVSRRVAQAYWPGQSAVGQPIVDGGSKQTYTVVGVAPDVPWFAWDLESPIIYAPYVRTSRSSLLSFFVRLRRPGGRAIDDLVGAITRADPHVRPNKAVPLSDGFRETIALRRFQSWLAGSLAAAALAVTGVGILGLLAMSTARRTREIGIRCALGATPRVIARSLVREQFSAVVSGLVAGGLIAAWAVTLVRGYVYRLSVADPRIWVAAIALILITAGVGALLPALRASRIDPLKALRME